MSRFPGMRARGLQDLGCSSMWAGTSWILRSGAPPYLTFCHLLGVCRRLNPVSHGLRFKRKELKAQGKHMTKNKSSGFQGRAAGLGMADAIAEERVEGALTLPHPISGTLATPNSLLPRTAPSWARSRAVPPHEGRLTCCYHCGEGQLTSAPNHPSTAPT